MHIDRFITAFFDPHIIAETAPRIILVGFKYTLILTVGSVAIGLVIGMVLALMVTSRRRWLRLPGKIYVDIFRGVPGLLSIFVIGAGLPLAGIAPFGRNIFAYAMVAIGLIQGAYICEIFRSGIEGIGRQQMEAARGLGLSHGAAMRYIIVPQGIRHVLPSLTGQVIIAIKETALVYVLGIVPANQELFSAAQSASTEYASMTPVVIAGLMYLVLTVPMTHLVNAMDARIRRGPAFVLEGGDDADVATPGTPPSGEPGRAR